MEIKQESRQEGNIKYHIISDKIWHIEDENGVFCSLVMGRDKAILFDTGFGNIGIKPFVERHISTELMVINSHGHPEHIGGNGAFETIYAASAEMDLLFANWYEFKKKPIDFLMRDIEPGTYIDLGDEKAEVIKLSGHSVGSIGLLLHNSGILLAGDAFNEELWLFNPGTMSINAWRESAREACKLDFTYFLTGHSRQLYTKAYIEVLIQGSLELSVQKSKPVNIAGRDVLKQEHEHNGKKVSIIFDERVLGDIDFIELPVAAQSKNEGVKVGKRGLIARIFRKV